MTTPPKQKGPKAEAALVRLPVFASPDPIGRAMAMAIAGKREMQVSVRGERLVEHIVEVERELSMENIIREVPITDLIEVIKIKMYDENINDQMVYDLLFEDRLERQWARAYRSETKSFWKKPGR